MRKRLGGVALGLVVACGSGCGARSRPATVEDGPDAGDLQDARAEAPPPPPCTLAESPGRIRVEAISPEGLVAYAVQTQGGEHEVWVVADCGEPPVLAFQGIRVVRFGGETLVGFRGIDRPEEEPASQMVAWRPGDPSATLLAETVDPGGVHFSRDGRYVSIEAGDALGDNRRDVDLLLYRLADFSLVATVALSSARARFTRDSAWWVYSGVDLDSAAAGFGVWRQAVDGGAPEEVTRFDMDARWELSADGAWLVHGLGDNLVRTPLAQGPSEVLAPGLITVEQGKELDVSSGDALVAFLALPARTSVEPALCTVPFAGGPIETLFPAGVRSILDFHRRVLTFERDDMTVFAIAPRGGPAVDLGESRVVDEDEQSLLALGPSELRFLALPPQGGALLEPDVAYAALGPAGVVLLARDPSAPAALELWEPTSGRRDLLLQSSVGPFIVHEDRLWLAAVVEEVGRFTLTKIFLEGPRT